jgi:hypothetical protein
VVRRRANIGRSRKSMAISWDNLPAMDSISIGVEKRRHLWFSSSFWGRTQLNQFTVPYHTKVGKTYMNEGDLWFPHRGGAEISHCERNLCREHVFFEGPTTRTFWGRRVTWMTLLLYERHWAAAAGGMIWAVKAGVNKNEVHVFMLLQILSFCSKHCHYLPFVSICVFQSVSLRWSNLCCGNHSLDPHEMV